MARLNRREDNPQCFSCEHYNPRGDESGNRCRTGIRYTTRIVDCKAHKPFVDGGIVPESERQQIKEGYDLADSINPSHYKGKDGFELIELIHDMPFWKANVIKYVYRSGKKDGNSKMQDLKKALWYLEREINNERT